MLLLLFGLVDVIAGIVLALSSIGRQALLFWLAVIMLVKALYSIGAAFVGGFFLDLLGFLDLAAAILLFLSYSGIFMHFFIYIGIILAAKGVYSIVMDMIK